MLLHTEAHSFASERLTGERRGSGYPVQNKQLDCVCEIRSNTDSPSEFQIAGPTRLLNNLNMNTKLFDDADVIYYIYSSSFNQMQFSFHFPCHTPPGRSTCNKPHMRFRPAVHPRLTRKHSPSEGRGMTAALLLFGSATMKHDKWKLQWKNLLGSEFDWRYFQNPTSSSVLLF